MSLTKPHSQQILHVPVEVGRVARSQYGKNQDAVSLLDFGFVAGEASDNADAWTRLANEVNAQQEGGGLRILVPPGVWRTTVQPLLFTQQVWLIGSGAEIGRANVCTPVTNARPVCRLLLEQKKYTSLPH